MKKISTSNKIFVKESGIKNAGRGVFAKENIKKGETIEIAPFIEISENDTSKLKESILVTYFFYFGKNKEKIALALGFGSLYNHSDKANMIYKIECKEKTIKFTALRDIKKGEEITFNYRNESPDKKEIPLWFEK
jgi:hypothetical protein